MASSNGNVVGGVLLTAEEELEFREIFNLVDRDGGGSISKEEYARFLAIEPNWRAPI